MNAYGRTKGEIEAAVNALTNPLNRFKWPVGELVWTTAAFALVVAVLFSVLASTNWLYYPGGVGIIATLAVIGWWLLPPRLPNGLTSVRAPITGRIAYYSGGGLAGFGQVALFVGLLGFPTFLPGLAILFVFGAIQLLGRRLLQPSASELQTFDIRRPIVLLRSFGDDRLRIVTGYQGEKGDFKTGDLQESIEDQFEQFGPFVAVGTPHERLPTLGAARNYYADTEWKVAIAKWMDEALALVVIANFTDGVVWEIDCVRQHGHLGKLFVLMPPRVKRTGSQIFPWLFRLRRGWKSESYDRAQRWQRLRAALAGDDAFRELPDEIPDRLIGMHFAGDGKLILLVGPEVSWKRDYQRAIRFALYGMLCHATERGQRTAATPASVE